MKFRVSTGLAGLLAMTYFATAVGCQLPAFVSTLALQAQSPSRPAEFPALQIKSKPLTSLVTTSGTVTWYGPGYEGNGMNGGGRYRDRGPIVFAVPIQRDRKGRPIFGKGGRHLPTIPYGTTLRVTIPDGRSIIGIVRDTCSGMTFDTNRTGMSGLGFRNPQQKIKGARVEVLY